MTNAQKAWFDAHPDFEVAHVAGAGTAAPTASSGQMVMQGSRGIVLDDGTYVPKGNPKALERGAIPVRKRLRPPAVPGAGRFGP